MSDQISKKELQKQKFRAKLAQILDRHLPEGFLELGVRLWDEHPFSFHVSRERKTKVGDYRFERDVKIHRITVNHNLNRYGFLITYLHEVAHMHAMILHGPGIDHHGKEWKMAFKKLLIEALSMNLLPKDITAPLAAYAKNPKASTYSDPKLVMALSRYDADREGAVFLASLKNGSQFNFLGNTYRYIEKRRSRILCLRIDNQRNYLISGHARVEID